MKNIRRPLLALYSGLCALVCLSGVGRADDSIGYFDAIANELPPVVGETYYTRHTFMHEKGDHSATNYWRGTLVPINTRVTLVALRKKDMTLLIEASGERVTVVNTPKFTLKDMATIARNMLTSTPVPIERFGDDMARRIRNGTMQTGMTKEQVVMTRGYPPGHKTSSLDLDTWLFWSSKLVIHTIVFEDGVLARGRGID